MGSSVIQSALTDEYIISGMQEFCCTAQESHVVAHGLEDQAIVSTRGHADIDVDVNPELRFDFIRGCRLIVANCRLS